MLHCGACREKFITGKELMEHLKVCKGASAGRQMLDSAMNDEEVKEVAGEAHDV